MQASASMHRGVRNHFFLMQREKSQGISTQLRMESPPAPQYSRPKPSVPGALLSTHRSSAAAAIKQALFLPADTPEDGLSGKRLRPSRINAP